MIAVVVLGMVVTAAMLTAALFLIPAGAGEHTDGNRLAELARGVAWQAAELAERLRRYEPSHRVLVYEPGIVLYCDLPEQHHEPTMRELAAVEAEAAPLSAPRAVPAWIAEQLAVTGFVIEAAQRAMAHPWPHLDRHWKYGTGTLPKIIAAMTP